jgi:hypothetical protein
MDLRTGRTYESVEQAGKAGVPLSDLVQVKDTPTGPDVQVIASGPFKGRVYKRNALGQRELVATDGGRRPVRR